MGLAGIGDVQFLLVRRKGQAVGHVAIFDHGLDLFGLRIDPRDEPREQSILGRRKENARRRHHRAVERAEGADGDRGRDDDHTRGTDHQPRHIRRDQLGVLHLLDGNEVEVDEVGAEIEHDDRRGADQQRARQDLLRILDLAADEREIGPAVVGPQDRHHRQQE